MLNNVAWLLVFLAVIGINVGRLAGDLQVRSGWEEKAEGGEGFLEEENAISLEVGCSSSRGDLTAVNGVSAEGEDLRCEDDFIERSPVVDGERPTL